MKIGKFSSKKENILILTTTLKAMGFVSYERDAANAESMLSNLSVAAFVIQAGKTRSMTVVVSRRNGQPASSVVQQ